MDHSIVQGIKITARDYISQYLQEQMSHDSPRMGMPDYTIKRAGFAFELYSRYTCVEHVFCKVNTQRMCLMVGI
jgi:hypothetical protein